MKENITAARPYAQAVFEQAREENNLTQWSESLNLIKLVVSDPQMQRLLGNPTIKSDFIAGLILDVCGDNLTDKGKNFIRLLAQARRLPLAPQIYTLYEQLRTEAEDIVDVEISSAFPLEESEKDAISNAMNKRLGKKINITTNIDEKLIGGVVIRAGDSVIDASVMGRLKQLGSRLAE